MDYCLDGAEQLRNEAFDNEKELLLLRYHVDSKRKIMYK